jgi:hypothetical protein
MAQSQNASHSVQLLRHHQCLAFDKRHTLSIAPRSFKSGGNVVISVETLFGPLVHCVITLDLQVRLFARLLYLTLRLVSA